ncbi:MAG: methyl-accepting chemotaxis protein [Gammaproteobacteria bacterium]|nr:methyl-accepting chemotaxis protein [Gammaproteobacteria bacterium]
MADSRNVRALGAPQYALLAIASAAMIVALGLFFWSQRRPPTTAGDAMAALAADTQRMLASEPGAEDALTQALRNVDRRVTAAGAEGRRLWSPVRGAAEDLLKQAPSVAKARQAAAALQAALPAVESDYGAIAAQLAERGAPAAQLYLAADQLIKLAQLRAAAAQALTPGSDAKALAAALNQATQSFLSNNQTLIQPPTGGKDATVADRARDGGKAFAAVAAAAGDLGAALPALAQARADAQRVEDAVPPLTRTLGGLASTAISPLQWVIYGAGLTALLALLIFIASFNLTVRSRQAQQQAQEKRQQEAILQLLDDITNLANGDLTVEAQVTADFTGAIADSINYTVQTLRSLVGTINQTSRQVVSAAASTQRIAKQMSGASERQSREIAEVTEAITESSHNLNAAADRAEELSVQAQKSVETANDGAATVGRTIQTMATLRDQIQDTAKRIKRLGESSQEIGNIIEFINDIAEQTNTLALNASIQAAMAGEAGRGFAVVAEQVQQLAERAGSATRQIETLVKTIQTDTQEAVSSMERSTSNVVAGARSAEEAGQSLTRIETSSRELAQLIGDIAGTVRAQSEQATSLAGTMRSIQQVAVQTSSSADQTSRAVGELNTMSDQLRESVAGFRLPEENDAAA